MLTFIYYLSLCFVSLISTLRVCVCVCTCVCVTAVLFVAFLLLFALPALRASQIASRGQIKFFEFEITSFNKLFIVFLEQFCFFFHVTTNIHINFPVILRLMDMKSCISATV